MEDAMIADIGKAKMLAESARLKALEARKNSKLSSPEDLEKAAQEFEAVFLSQMMEHLFADVDLSPGHDGPGEDIYKSLLVDEYGKLMSRSGGVGIADHVKRELIRVQESAQQAAATTNSTETEMKETQ